jgi:SnoaL-like protein
MHENTTEKLQRLVDRAEIYDVMCRYARGIDRGDPDFIKPAYHPDAYDDHGDYKGNIDGFIEWLGTRFVNFDNSMHFLGNCLIEFAGPDLALVETYYASRRLRAPVADECAGLAPDDVICRQAWGRYLDRFERRNGEWRIANRIVVVDARFTSVAKGGARNGPSTWGTRDRSDPYYAVRAEVFRDASNRGDR